MTATRGPASCLHRGALVDGRSRVPDAAWERWSAGPEVGCNHLVCGRCGQPVHQRTDGSSRVYACQCSSRTVDAPQRLADEGRDVLAPTVAWSCAGHPAVPWPIDLDGVRLDDAADVDGIVRDALAGRPGVPPDVRESLHRGWWLERLIDLVPGWAPRVFELAGDALDDDDPQVVRRAIDLLKLHPSELPIDGVVFRWKRLAAVPDPWGKGKTLGTGYADALAARVRAEGRQGPAADGARDLLAGGCDSGTLRYALGA